VGCAQARCACPEPPGRLPLTDGTLANEVMPLWAFAVGFERVLTLASFYPDDFCAALQRKERSVRAHIARPRAWSARKVADAAAACVCWATRPLPPTDVDADDDVYLRRSVAAPLSSLSLSLPFSLSLSRSPFLALPFSLSLSRSPFLALPPRHTPRC
jgi:hypothetical protein